MKPALLIGCFLAATATLSNAQIIDAPAEEPLDRITMLEIFATADVDLDGLLDPVEAGAIEIGDEMFAALDDDDNGYLTIEEFYAARGYEPWRPEA